MDLSKIDFKSIPVHKNHYINQNKKIVRFSSPRELVTHMFRSLGKGYLAILYEVNTDYMEEEIFARMSSYTQYLPNSDADIFKLIGFYHINDLLIEQDQKEILKTMQSFKQDSDFNKDRVLCLYHTTSLYNMKIYKITGIPYFKPLKGMNLHTIKMMSVMQTIV